jgi:menaquinone-dependent protoporphyrinogen oxidase
MSSTVLVSYGTKYGSTKEVAEAIAETLRGCGPAVECLPAGKVTSVDGYVAVVLGAPLYIGAWHKDAVNLLSRQQAALAGKPVVIFGVGPVSADEKERQGALEQLNKVLAKFPWLKPVTVEMFAGKYDPAKLRFPDNLLGALPASPLHNMPAKDSRDWTAIRAWAAGLVPQLGLAVEA